MKKIKEMMEHNFEEVKDIINEDKWKIIVEFEILRIKN